MTVIRLKGRDKRSMADNRIRIPQSWYDDYLDNPNGEVEVDLLQTDEGYEVRLRAATSD